MVTKIFFLFFSFLSSWFNGLIPSPAPEYTCGWFLRKDNRGGAGEDDCNSSFSFGFPQILFFEKCAKYSPKKYFIESSEREKKIYMLSIFSSAIIQIFLRYSYVWTAVFEETLLSTSLQGELILHTSGSNSIIYNGNGCWSIYTTWI